MPWPALIYVCSAALTYPVHTHIDTFRHMQTQTDTDKQTQMLQKKTRSGKDTQILSVLLWQGHSFAAYTLFQVFLFKHVLTIYPCISPKAVFRLYIKSGTFPKTCMVI